MNTRIVIFIFLVISQFSYSQSSQINQSEVNTGELITSSGDTLFVEYKLNKISSNEVYYRVENNKGSFKVGTPNTIDIIYTRQSTYFSVEVGGKKQFAKRLISGLATLFIVESDLLRVYLIRDSNGEYTILNKDNYKNSISKLFGNCINEDELEKLSFSTKSLQQSVLRFNSCMSPEKYEFVKIKSEPKIFILANAGLTTYSISKTNDVVYNTLGDLMNVEGNLSLTYDLGINAQFLINKIKFSLGLHYSPLKYTTESGNTGGEVNLNFVSIPFDVLTQINSKTFIGLGVSVGTGGVKASPEATEVNSDINSTTIDFGSTAVSMNYGLVGEYWISRKLAIQMRVIKNVYSGTGSIDLTGFSGNFSLNYVFSKDNY